MKFPDIRLPISCGYLYQLEARHVNDSYVDGLNDPVVNKFLEVRKNVQTINSVKEFVSANAEAEDSVLWGIWTQDENKLVGSVRLHEIGLNGSYCHLGICVFDKFAWGRGIATSSIKVSAGWAFRQFGLTKIYAGVDPKNIASGRAFLRAGFEFVCCETGSSLIFGDTKNRGVFLAYPNSQN